MVPSWTRPSTIAAWPVDLVEHTGLVVGVPAGWRPEVPAPDASIVVHRGPNLADALVVQRVADADESRPLGAWMDAILAVAGFPVPELLGGSDEAAPALVEWSAAGDHVFGGADDSQLYEGLAVLPGHPAELARLFTVLLRCGADAWRVTLSLLSACPPGAPAELVASNDGVRAATTFGCLAMAPSWRWGAALRAWAIPAEILAQAPASPWVHPPRLFDIDAGAVPADSPSHRVAREALGAGGAVLDVGCGGGRSSLPLAPAASSVTGVDEQEAMLDAFAAAFERAGITHREVPGRWPDVAGDVAAADVVVCHHVVYNVEAIEPFVSALTEHARRLVVVELPEHHPMSPFAPLWRHFWGLDRLREPSADLFAELVRSLGHDVAVERVVRAPRKPAQRDAGYVEFVRRRLCLGPERDDEIATRLALLDPRPNEATVTVSWAGSADAAGPLSSRS